MFDTYLYSKLISQPCCRSIVETFPNMDVDSMNVNVKTISDNLLELASLLNGGAIEGIINVVKGKSNK